MVVKPPLERPKPCRGVPLLSQLPASVDSGSGARSARRTSSHWRRQPKTSGNWRNSGHRTPPEPRPPEADERVPPKSPILLPTRHPAANPTRATRRFFNGISPSCQVAAQVRHRVSRYGERQEGSHTGHPPRRFGRSIPRPARGSFLSTRSTRSIQKAMPVTLAERRERETWPSAHWAEASALQSRLPHQTLTVIGK